VSACEHEDRIARAIFAIERMWGAGKFDKAEIISILRGKR
jgi:hypothetical protein